MRKDEKLTSGIRRSSAGRRLANLSADNDSLGFDYECERLGIKLCNDAYVAGVPMGPKGQSATQQAVVA